MLAGGAIGLVIAGSGTPQITGNTSANNPDNAGRSGAIAGFLAEAGVAAERVQVLAGDRTKKIVNGRVRLRLQIAGN